MRQLRSLVGLDREACMISRLHHYEAAQDGTTEKKIAEALDK
jgi:hypothetical protein